MQASITSITQKPEELDPIAEQFTQQISCLPLIKLLCRMTKAVQKHRGASMACLGGNTSFIPQVQTLQMQIEKLFSLINHYNNNSVTILPLPAFENTLHDWESIKIGWQHDAIIQNFEFHSHLIENLKQLIRNIWQEHLSSPLHENDKQLLKLLPVILHVMPENIELLAKLRGLGTHCSVSKNANDDTLLRIGYMQKQITVQYKQLLHTLQDIKDIRASLPAISNVQGMQMRLESLLSYVDKHILQTSEISADSEYLFQTSTEIIDAYWLLVEQGISMIEQLLFDRFMLWVEE